jgi:biotin carboxylase
VNSSSKKTLLVLAASYYQCEAIRTAQRLGYRVVTTDNRPENPGHRLADCSYSVDTTDRAGVLEIARGEGLAGVLAPCTDVAMPTAAYVAGALGLRGPSVASTATACDKILFRQFLQRHRFPVPQWMEERGAEAPELAWPGDGRWIVKPSQSSGSKGVVVVESAKELRAALPAALAFSKSGEAIVEQYLDGHQGTLEGWLRGGEIAWHCLLDRETAPLPHTATHGHAAPSVLSHEQSAAVLESTARLWRELGVSDGPFDCDFVMLGHTVYLLEVSPRLGGNAICELVRSACGLDLVEHTVRWACGEPVGELRAHPPEPRAIVLLGSERAGRLHFDREQASALAREPWVESLEWDMPLESVVHPFTDGRHRIGQALLAATDRDELTRRIREVRDRLSITAR